MAGETSESNDGLSELMVEDEVQDDEMQIGKWKRHEFSDYLTKTGVSAALANAVLELCRAEERPSDPIEFVRTRMRPDNEDITEINVYRRKIKELQPKLDWLRVERDKLLEQKRKLQTLQVDELVCEDHIIIDDEDIL